MGLVSPTAVPFTSLPLGKTTFQITTSVGRCLHTYDLRKGLNLVFLTRPQAPEDITATRAWKDKVLAAWGGVAEGSNTGVWVFKRGKLDGALEMPKGEKQSIQSLIVFGSWIVGCTSKRIEVWKSATYEHYTTLIPTASRGYAEGVLTGDLISMPTFLNKVVVGKRDGAVDIWNVSTGKLVYTILPLSSDSGAVTALEASPALSIIAIAHEGGVIRLHDIRTDKAILTINAKTNQASHINSISFRTDGLGAGYEMNKQGIMATASAGIGDVTLWDLNDGGRIKGILRGAHNPIGSAATGGINKVEFLPGQDVMITTGMDNALRSWIFDANTLSPIPRILHSRCGHAAPVTRLSFVPSASEGADADGKWLMSSGRDQSLWGWSLRRDGQSTELSQGNVQKKAKKLGLLGKNLETEPSTTLDDLKAPEIVSMACSLNRDGGMGASAGGGKVWSNTSNKKGPADASETNATGWESVVTAHKGDKRARTWFWGRKKAGRWAFESSDGADVTTVAISSCGTFALIGSAGGSISMFNLQSGIQRRKFPAPITPAQARKMKLSMVTSDDNQEAVNGKRRFQPGFGKHTQAVTGLMVDGLNRTVISCSLDGKVKFWDFASGCLLDEIDWASMTSITSAQYHRNNDLVAFSCDDQSLRVIDTETRKLVRELWGCQGQISDFCFSNDSRWIIAASIDSAIRVWDLPTGHLINAFRLESPCTSVAFSDTGEFLATAHSDSAGINIWNNRALFTHVPTRLLQKDEVTPVMTPNTSGEGGQSRIDAAFEDAVENVDNEDDSNGAESSVDQISKDLLSLSIVPKSRWQTLLHLDNIRQRNKPKEPPKAPEKAPFFLPSLDGREQDLPATRKTDDHMQITAAERSRITKMSRTTDTVSALLHSGAGNVHYEAFINHFSSLSPSAADIEIRSLDLAEMPAFIHALTFRLQQKRDFELVQAWMAVFLRVHGDIVPANASLKQALQDWRIMQTQERARLAALIGFCGGVVSFLRSSR